jgi:hypothetical protein
VERAVVDGECLLDDELARVPGSRGAENRVPKLLQMAYSDPVPMSAAGQPFKLSASGTVTTAPCPMLSFR